MVSVLFIGPWLTGSGLRAEAPAWAVNSIDDTFLAAMRAQGFGNVLGSGG